MIARVEFVAIEEIHAAALRNLPTDVTAYLEEGAGAESTLRANREAFGKWVIQPRPMSGVSDPDTSATVLGIPLAVPILTSPFGGDALFHPDGQLAVARANAACGTASIAPEIGSFSYEAVRAAAPSAVRIAQVHPYESFPWVAERPRPPWQPWRRGRRQSWSLITVAVRWTRLRPAWTRCPRSSRRSPAGSRS
jgi:4-hydroxymandelate oxidase